MNHPETYCFELSELNIEISAISKLMGYGNEAPAEIEEMIQKEINFPWSIDEIKGGYLICEALFHKEKYEITIADKTFSVGKSLWKLFNRSTQIAVFACTAGEKISNRAAELMNKGDLIEGYIVDVLGSVIVEAAMDKIHDKLKEQLLQENIQLTNRYSPGYCDWHVAEQRKLFTLLPEHFCGIQLSESALMQPIKSVSGFMGLGSDVKFHKHTCDLCTQANCIYGNKKNVK